MARKSSRKIKPIGKIPKIIVLALFVSFLAILTVKGVADTIKNSDMFRIRGVLKAPSLQHIDSRYLETLRGKNIFDVDLSAVQRRLQSQYPEIDQLKVIRRFPDKISLMAKKREPFARVGNDRRTVLVDREGVVLSFDKSSEFAIPRIDGIPVSMDVVLGRHLRSQELGLALNIIETVQEESNLARYQIVSLDVGNLSQIRVALSNGVNVIMDRDHIQTKVRNLGILMAEGNLRWNEINYIDLRFKEPLLGQK